MDNSSMMIHTARIPESGIHLREEEPGSILELEEHDEFRAAGPVSCDLYAQVVDGMLIVRGTLSVPIEARCARCTQIFSTTVGDSGFLRDFPVIEGSEEVDITEDLREALILNLPRFPLCSGGCRGLCPQCGKSLNDGPCGCRPPEEAGSWDALDKLNL